MSASAAQGLAPGLPWPIGSCRGNQGGDLVEATLRTVDPTVSYKAVNAARGKRTRVEPVALYEQRRVHRVGGFPELEDQCAALPDGGGGPDDRLDALVYGLTRARPRNFRLGPLR